MIWLKNAKKNDNDNAKDGSTEGGLSLPPLNAALANVGRNGDKPDETQSQEVVNRRLVMKVRVFSVGGYHPTTGELSYSAYKMFSSEDNAKAFKSEQHGNSCAWSREHIVVHTEDAVQLAPGLPGGTLVFWSTFGGGLAFGWLKEYDNGTAIVAINGRELAVRA